MKIYYRFGIPEKELLENKDSLYDGIIISAHVAEYYRKAVSLFLGKTKKPYFIDPVTYAFARDPQLIKKNGKLKKAYLKLSVKYGSLIEKTAGKYPLYPDKLTDKSVVDDFCQKVIGFQRSFKTPKTVMRYRKMLGTEEEDVIKAPQFLVPPYFYCVSVDDPWYDVNLNLAECSERFKGSSSAFPVICISQEVVQDSDSINKIIKDYRDFAGYLIWVSGMNERFASIEVLQGYVDLIKGLSEGGKEVYSLYGGYFSGLSSKFGLSAFGNGVCYGESKNVDAEAGGAPPVRFYVPEIKNKAMEVDSRDFYTEHEDEDLLCDCNVCTNIKSGSGDNVQDFFDTIKEKPRLAKEHFMECRKDEIDKIEKLDKEDLIEELEENYEYFNNELDSFLFRGFDVSHLKRWSLVIST